MKKKPFGDGVERGGPGGLVELLGAARDEGAAGGVDEGVEAAELGRGARDEPAGVVRVCEIDLHGGAAAPQGAHAGAGLLCPTGRAVVRDGHVGAVLGEVERERGAQAARATGEKTAHAVDVHGCVVPREAANDACTSPATRAIVFSAAVWAA